MTAWTVFCPWTCPLSPLPPAVVVAAAAVVGVVVVCAAVVVAAAGVLVVGCAAVDVAVVGVVGCAAAAAAAFGVVVVVGCAAVDAAAAAAECDHDVSGDDHARSSILAATVDVSNQQLQEEEEASQTRVHADGPPEPLRTMVTISPRLLSQKLTSHC